MEISNGERITIGQLEIRYLVEGAASGVFELIVPPGAHVPPPHSHRNNEESIYCLEGVLRCIAGDKVRDLKAGECSYTPRGVTHGFSNPHEQTARALFVLTPDIGAQYFRDIAEVVNAGRGPDPAKIVEIMTRYGLELAPPAR